MRPKTKAAQEYAEKLRDPRWQERRQQILRRDYFTCRGCGDKDAIPDPEDDSGIEPYKARLEVHHRYYEWGNNPWEYPDEALITLCEMCHDYETVHMKDAEKDLIQAARTRFLARGISALACALRYLKLPYYEFNTSARILTWAMTDREAMHVISEMYKNRARTTLIGEEVESMFEAMKEIVDG